MRPVAVVTGAKAEGIESALGGSAVQIVHNPAWEDGQSPSVHAGITTLLVEVDALIFLLDDQPYVTKDVFRALIAAYAQNRPKILATFVGEWRTNPVPFDRCLFSLPTHLQGDVGARSIFTRYPPSSLPWADERLLLDVDTLRIISVC